MPIKTVLIVDDHADTNEAMCLFVRAMGHRAVSASTGEGALAMIGSEKPDLVILDAMMPGINGPEVLRIIRANPNTATLPVVVYSAVSDPQFQQNALAKGATEYWVKWGMEASELCLRMSKYLGAAQSPDPRHATGASKSPDP